MNASRSALLGAVVLAAAFVSTPSRAGPGDCLASASEREAFLAREMIAEIDRGRDRNGAYPEWMQKFLRDPDTSAEALAKLCDRSPSETLTAALRRLPAEPIEAALQIRK